MDFFDRRQQLKQEFSDYYEKSLTKKYQPETPAQWSKDLSSVIPSDCSLDYNNKKLNIQFFQIIMRLSQILAVWPRNRPNGHIWSGKHRMVEKVKHNHMVKMEKSIQMVRYMIIQLL